MKSLWVIATASFAIGGIAAPAAPTGGQEAEKKICKVMGLTGTRVPTRRLCLTKAEWAKRDQEFKEQISGEMRKGDLKNSPTDD